MSKHNNALSILSYGCGACMCRFTNCALHALFHRPLPLSCTDRCFLACLLSFFYSNFFASLSSFLHLRFPPRLDCVSNLRLSISHISVSLFLVQIASLISFIRSHPCEVGLLRGVVSMDCNAIMGIFPHHLRLLNCSHHAASVVAMHWVH
jgi:hypothetical protein